MSILDTIVARTRADLAGRDTPGRCEQLFREASTAPRPRSLEAALKRPPQTRARVIAELKRASPSKGLIRQDFNATVLATSLAGHGASALSVLTEPHYFKGGPESLREAAEAVTVPVLRKDFIVAEVQLLEARAWGASAVLLIAAALSPREYTRLYGQAGALGLSVLSEVHNREELDMVLNEGAHIVGVNSRDLGTFKVDLGVAEDLLSRIPDDMVKVAESGIRSASDMKRLMRAGADAFLIGETLMRHPEPGQALADLLADALPEPDGGRAG